VAGLISEKGRVVDVKWIVIDYTDTEVANTNSEPTVEYGALVLFKGGITSAIFAPGEWKGVYREDD
jgi:hypothetical protein